MKKLFLSLLFLTFAVTVSAQFQSVGNYKADGSEKPVSINLSSEAVAIVPTLSVQGQFIFLKGKTAVESFRNSLVDMKKEYIAKKESVKEVGKSIMSTRFDKFTMAWKIASNSTGMGVCDDLHPIFELTRKKARVIIFSTVKNAAGAGEADLFIRFQSEEEIQSLIDLLNTCIERLGGASSSQNSSASSQSPSASSQNSNVKKMSDYSHEFVEAEGKFGQPVVFEYAHAKNKAFYGFIYPGEMEKLKAVCFYLYSGSMDYRYYHVIPSKEICDMWIKTLTDMKELFIKNDKIAKDNNVIADVDKDVSDKFIFLKSTDQIGIRVSSFNVLRYQLKFQTHGYGYGFNVRYLYSKGASSMILYFPEGDSLYEVYRFDSVKDFDDFINALNWANYMKAFNVQAQKIKDKQALEAKKKQQQALFD